MRSLRRASVLVVALVIAAPSLAGAQTTSGADLMLKLEGPAATPLVGETFTLGLKVTNGGPLTAEQASLSAHVPPELELLTAASSDASDVCSNEGGGGGTEPAIAPGRGGSISCSLGDLASGGSVTVTLGLKRVGARGTYVSIYSGSNTEDPIYDNNYADLFLEPDKSHPADMAVSITGPDAPAVGSRFDYVTTVRNHGPSASAGTLTNSLNGVELIEWAADVPVTCEKNVYDPSYGGYAELHCNIAELAAGSAAKVTLTVERSSAWELYNSTSVSAAGLDENYDNDYAYLSVPADPSVTSDLGLKMTGPATTPLVGEVFDVGATITNAGPSRAGDVWLNNYLPDGVTAESVSPSDRCTLDGGGSYPYADGPTAVPEGKSGDAYYPVYGQGVNCSLEGLAPAESVDVTLTLRRTKAREIWNSAWVSSSNFDPIYENNYAELLIEPDRSNPADIAVSMAGPEGKPAVGELVSITLGATNRGPSEARDVVVAAHVPFGLELRESVTEQCTYPETTEPPPPEEKIAAPSSYGWRELRCTLGSIPSGESREVTAVFERTTEYEIWMGAWGEVANYDENYENDYAELLIAGEPYPGMCGGDTVTGTDGSDEITIGICSAESKAGSDTIDAAPSSSSGDMEIRAGRGADRITVSLGVESAERRTIHVLSGPGRDTIELHVAPGVGNATVILEGNAGNDVIDLRMADGSKGLRVRVRGHDGDDVLTGANAGADTLVPGLVLVGGLGNDILEGGSGPDLLFGGPGRDRLFGGNASDRLDGGRGRDTCQGGPGTNTTVSC